MIGFSATRGNGLVSLVTPADVTNVGVPGQQPPPRLRRSCQIRPAPGTLTPSRRDSQRRQRNLTRLCARTHKSVLALVVSAAERSTLLRDVKILIVDDSTLNRETLAAIFTANGAATPSIAWDLTSLIAAFGHDTPGIILLNIATRDSAALLRVAAEISPNSRVIVLGVSGDDEAQIVACAEAGVCGYHLRTESLDDLLVLIGKVASGESLFSPGVSAMLLRRLSALAARRQPVAKELVLTAREAQVLCMLEMGLSNRNIADHLGIAIHTVKNHVRSVLTKLGVSTRAEAAALARAVGCTEGQRRN